MPSRLSLRSRPEFLTRCLLQICSYAKGRGKWCGGPYLPPGAYYQSIAARVIDPIQSLSSHLISVIDRAMTFAI